MLKHLKFLAVTAIVAGIAAPALAQDGATPDADTVVATVNDQEITLGHMIAARATLDQRYDDFPPQQLYDGILEQLIQQTALAQKVDQLPRIVALTLENEERSLKAGEAINTMLEGAVTDDDIKASYDEQFANFESQEEFNASHILVETEEDAQAVKEAIDAGADFAATAREKSTGPSGPNGGQLGWFSSGMMVPEFEAATIALEKGQVSDPVQTQFGWHVILLNDIRKTEPPALEEVRENIAANLRNQIVREILQKATDEVSVEIPLETGIQPEMLTQTDMMDQ